MFTLNTITGVVTRNSDGAIAAPAHSLNDPVFLEWIQWCDAGNSPTQVAIEPAPAFDPAVYQRAVTAAVQSHLDAAAQLRGFDNIFTAATYVGSVIPRFNNDATALRNWRDLCWAYCYQVLADVQAGTRTIPTVEELLAELPTLEELT